jgi:hypothetical protein
MTASPQGGIVKQSTRPRKTSSLSKSLSPQLNSQAVPGSGSRDVTTNSNNEGPPALTAAPKKFGGMAPVRVIPPMNDEANVNVLRMPVEVRSSRIAVRNGCTEYGSAFVNTAHINIGGD